MTIMGLTTCLVRVTRKNTALRDLFVICGILCIIILQVLQMPDTELEPMTTTRPDNRPQEEFVSRDEPKVATEASASYDVSHLVLEGTFEVVHVMKPSYPAFERSNKECLTHSVKNQSPRLNHTNGSWNGHIMSEPP